MDERLVDRIAAGRLDGETVDVRDLHPPHSKGIVFRSLKGGLLLEHS